jgi:hypothetical protein
MRHAGPKPIKSVPGERRCCADERPPRGPIHGAFVEADASTFTYAPTPFIPAFAEQMRRRPKALRSLESVIHSGSSHQRLHPLAPAMLVSGRTFLTDEPASFGLIHRIVPDEQALSAALEYAGDLAANCSPASIKTMKAQLRPGSRRRTDWAVSDALLGRGVGDPAEVLVEDLAEDRLGGGGVHEQRDGRAQLLRVEVAEDLLRGAAC